MESWDDENFEPKVAVPATITSNKWEGEDEEEDVKDNWEDEDEEKKEEAPKPVPQKPKKKPVQERIAEKEKQKAEEVAKKIQEEEEQEDEISPEEQMRRQKESDLNVALETTFGGSNSSIGIDSMDPRTKEDFQEFADAIVGKVQPYAKSAEYPLFAEIVVRNICATMSSIDIKKIKNTLDNLYLEKQKIEKGDKMRKSKAKGKAKLKMDNENQYSAYVEDYDEFDDFM